MTSSIVVTEHMAHVIMGAMSAAESEGITGLANTAPDDLDFTESELNVVRSLNELFPDVVRQYGHLSSVSKLKDES